MKRHFFVWVMLLAGGFLTNTVAQSQGPLPVSPVKQADSLLGAAAGPLQQLKAGIKPFEGRPAISVGAIQSEADYAYFQDTAGLGLGVFHNLSGIVGYNLNGTVTVAGMPFQFGVLENNGISTLNYTPFRNFYQFNFNHEQYLQSLRSQLMAKLDPATLMNSALSRVGTIRAGYERQLQTEVTQLQQEYTKEYHAPITLPAGATNLSPSDMNALRTQILPGDAVSKYQQDLTHLEDMRRNRDAKSLGKDTAYLHTVANVKRYETLEKIYTRITDWKKRFEGNPVVKELRSTSSLSPSALKAYLSDPKNLGQVLDDEASLNTLQKLFYNIKTLDLGQNAVQSNGLAFQNLVNTGANTEFQNKSLSTGIIYGKNDNSNNWQQAGLTSQVTNEYSNLSGFKLGTGMGSKVDQYISFDMFHLSNTGGMGQPGASAYLPVAPFQDGALSLHTGFEFSPKQVIIVDVSKSFGSYQQTSGVDPSGAGKLPSGSVFSGAGRSNYAGMLQYNGEIMHTDVRVFLKKVGLGYYNPGNVQLHSGESQAGLGLARTFLSRKLTFKYDGDYRRQVYDPYGNYTYSALSNKLQVGYKIDRSDKVNLTYQRSDYQSEFHGFAPMAGFTTRLQLDAGYRFYIDGNKVTNNTTISRQETSIPLGTGGNYRDRSLLVTSTSTFTVDKNPLSLTILANKSDNDSYYFNTSMVSAEVNYPYTLPGWPRMSSGIGYYDNAGWNSQFGVRQQVSALLKEKLSLDLQLSYRKAITIVQTALANQIFVNATMHYLFK
ncbi:MAG TPA: hypothetical protein VGM89_16740 [Puia sp.]